MNINPEIFLFLIIILSNSNLPILPISVVVAVLGTCKNFKASDVLGPLYELQPAV